MAATKAKRRPGGGGAAVIVGNEIAAKRTATSSKKQAGPAALDRACLSCGEPGVARLCAACDLQLALDRLAEDVLEHAEALAEEVEQSAPRLRVREHLRQKPRIRSSRPELQAAIECERQPPAGAMADGDSRPAPSPRRLPSWIR